jgi:hypothetical protein
MSVKMAIAYLESFIECDMNKGHHCNNCGDNSEDNQVDHSEVTKALDELNKLAAKTVKSKTTNVGTKGHIDWGNNEAN